MTRSRSCIAGNECGTGCVGPSTESRSCGTPVGKFLLHLVRIFRGGGRVTQGTHWCAPTLNRDLAPI